MKKLGFLMSVLAFSIILAGCGSSKQMMNDVGDNYNTGETTTLDSVENEITKFNDTDTVETQSFAINVDSTEYCDQYLGMMQCLVDSYPEYYGQNAEVDMAQLRNSINTEGLPDSIRNSMCAKFIMTMSDKAKDNDDYPADDICGLLDPRLNETDTLFYDVLQHSNFQ